MSEEAPAASPPASERSQQGADDNEPAPTPPPPADEDKPQAEEDGEPPATPKQDDNNVEEQPTNDDAGEEQRPAAAEGMFKFVFGWCVVFLLLYFNSEDYKKVIFVYTSKKIFMYGFFNICLLYTSPSPRDKRQSRMPSSA